MKKRPLQSKGGGKRGSVKPQRMSNNKGFGKGRDAEWSAEREKNAGPGVRRSGRPAAGAGSQSMPPGKGSGKGKHTGWDEDSEKQPEKRVVRSTGRRTVGDRTSDAPSGGRGRRKERGAEQWKDSSERERRPTGTTPSETRGGRHTDSKKPKERKSNKAGADTSAENMIRLNKYLADSGVASRRKADELIKEGVVRVNREVVNEPGTQVHPGDLVTVHGEPISPEKRLTYILLNKPKGYITTTSDEKGRKTVMDIVHSRSRIFPVGRLDRNTTGVLLFTNDGELANRLMHPRYEVSRVYSATLDKSLQIDDAKRISAGVELEDGMTNPCSIVIDPKKKNKVLLEITEGRNREVRRIFEALGYEVDKLDRKMYANLTTRGMKRGEFRHLTRQEVRELEEVVGIKARSVSSGQTPHFRTPRRRSGRPKQRRR